MNMDTNPFEAGLGFFIKLDKVHTLTVTNDTVVSDNHKEESLWNKQVPERTNTTEIGCPVFQMSRTSKSAKQTCYKLKLKYYLFCRSQQILLARRR